MANFFNFRKADPQDKPEPIIMPTNYNWGMNMRSYCRSEEYELEDLMNALSSSNFSGLSKSFALSPVFAAISLISNTIAALPINVKNNNNVIKNSIVAVLLKNNQLSRYNFIKNLVVDLLYHGNAYVYVEKKDGIPVRLQYLPQGDVRIDYRKQSGELKYYVSGYQNIPNVVLPENMIHLVKDVDDDGITGRGFKYWGIATIREYQKIQDAAGALYKDGLQTQGYYAAETPLTQKQQKEILESIRDQQVQGQRQVFLPTKFQFITAGQSATDAQLVDNRLFSTQEICRYFNISPILLGDLSKGSISSVEDANLLFYTNVISPLLCLIEEEFTRKLLPEGQIIDFDETELLRTSKQNQASYLSTLVSGGIMTIAEAREQLGLCEMEDTDKLIIPYTDISQNTIGENNNIQNNG